MRVDSIRQSARAAARPHRNNPAASVHGALRDEHERAPFIFPRNAAQLLHRGSGDDARAMIAKKNNELNLLFATRRDYCEDMIRASFALFFACRAAPIHGEIRSSAGDELDREMLP